MEELIPCNVCKGSHKWGDVNGSWGKYYYYGICPTTKLHILHNGATDYHYINNLTPPNNWSADTSYDMQGNCFEIVPNSGVYYGSVYNRAIDNTCILFNKEKEFIVIYKDLISSLDADEIISVQEMIVNTLNCYTVFGTDKTIYGEEPNNSCYLIPKKEYTLQELMKQHFNTHCRKPDSVEIFKEAYNRLVKDETLKCK